MKLPNFYHHSIFNSLREKIGAELIEYSQDLAWKRLIIKLEHEGIDVPIEEVDIKKDGSFEYKGQKVVVYIRDQSSRYAFQGEPSYKYHLAHCQTIRNMKNLGKYSKYVVTTRTDGKFIVNIIEGGLCVSEGIEQELKLCKYCIRKLNLNIEPEAFNLKNYFKDNFSSIYDKPKHSEYTAPINVYADDWDKISYEQRSLNDWHCQECGLNLNNNKELLHVHHIDSNKANNHLSNLKVLCVVCHANQPAHETMKATPDYKKCVQIKKAYQIITSTVVCKSCGYKNGLKVGEGIKNKTCSKCNKPLNQKSDLAHAGVKKETSIEKQLLLTVRKNPGLKGAHIAKLLNMDKSLVNATLYSLKDKNQLTQNDSYEWFCNF